MSTLLPRDYDELADDDPMLLTEEPMRPIPMRYVTLTSERELLLDTMERLGLAHAWVGHTLYALNECDTNAVRLDARERLAAGGIGEPTAYQLTRMVEGIVAEMVAAERGAKIRAGIDARLGERRLAEANRAIDDAIAASEAAA